MTNSNEQITLDSECFYIKGFKVVKGVLDNFSYLVTSVRDGFDYRVEEIIREEDPVFDDDGNEIEPACITKSWALATNHRVIREYDDESEADSDLNEIVVRKILEDDRVSIWFEREEAEKFLKEDIDLLVEQLLESFGEEDKFIYPAEIGGETISMACFIGETNVDKKVMIIRAEEIIATKEELGLFTEENWPTRINPGKGFSGWELDCAGNLFCIEE